MAPSNFGDAQQDPAMEQLNQFSERAGIWFTESLTTDVLKFQKPLCDFVDCQKGASAYEIESMPKDSSIKKVIDNIRKPNGASDVDKDLKEVVLSRDFTITTKTNAFAMRFTS
uniref:Uncharacterized protein n=1 Tax=Ditylenchus dipsaci TaxID=166011 RepID=A0A915DLW2_9BILA